MEFRRFTSLDNTSKQQLINKIVYEGLADRQYVVTEKLHGANFSFWCDGHQVRVASRNQFVDGTFFNCQSIINKHEGNLMAYHQRFYQPGDLLVVTGELFGANVQKEIAYGELQFAAFDITFNGTPMNKISARERAFEIGFKFVRIIDILSFEQALAITNTFKSHYTPTGFEGDNFAEGTVIDPVEPAWFSNGSRVYFKNKSPAFTEKKARVGVVKLPVNFSPEVQELFEELVEYATEARVSNVLSKIGKVESKEFGMVLGLTIKDMLEEFEGDTGKQPKIIAGDVWKSFSGALNREAMAVVRPVFVSQLE